MTFQELVEAHPGTVKSVVLARDPTIRSEVIDIPSARWDEIKAFDIEWFKAQYKWQTIKVNSEF